MYMDMFIRIVTTGDHTPLTITNWNDVLMDYLEAVQSKTAKRELSYTKEIAYLTNDIYLTRVLCGMLSKVYHTAIIDKLRERGYQYAFTPESYEKDIERVETSLKRHEVRIKSLQAESKQGEENETPPTEADFYRELDILAEFAKVGVIHPNEITVAQYCAKKVRFTEYIEAQKQNGR